MTKKRLRVKRKADEAVRKARDRQEAIAKSRRTVEEQERAEEKRRRRA